MTDIGEGLPRRRPSQEVEVVRIPITDRATRATVAAWKQLLIAAAVASIGGSVAWTAGTLLSVKEQAAVQDAIAKEAKENQAHENATLKADIASVKSELKSDINSVSEDLTNGLKEINHTLLRMNRGAERDR